MDDYAMGYDGEQDALDAEGVISELANDNYCEVHPWMLRELKLTREELTAFATLFELAHSDHDRRGRIDGAYLASLLDGSDPFDALQSLKKSGLVSYEIGGSEGGFTGFRVNDRAIAEKVSAARKKAGK